MTDPQFFIARATPREDGIYKLPLSQWKPVKATTLIGAKAAAQRYSVSGPVLFVGMMDDKGVIQPLCSKEPSTWKTLIHEK